HARRRVRTAVPAAGRPRARAAGRLARAGLRPVIPLITGLVVAGLVTTGRSWRLAVVLDVHVDLLLLARHLRLGVRLAGRGPGRVGGRLALGAARGVRGRLGRGLGPRPAHALPVREAPGDELALQADVLGRAQRLRAGRQPHERGVPAVQVT